MSFADVRREYEREKIGRLVWARLVDICRRVAWKYPPEIYNAGETWSDEAIEDLAQEVTLERLLKENQLDYVFDLAVDDDSLAKLLRFQVRRVLVHRRTKTVVDRLMARIRRMVTDDAFETHSLADESWVALPGSSGDLRRLTDLELRRGALLIDSIPRLPSSPTASRESKVYGRAELEELVQTLVTALNTVALGDIQRILEILLTAWLPTILREDEEDQASDSTPELELERSQMESLVETLANNLDPTLRLVLLGKSNGESDNDIARRVGRSRPWVADRKSEVLARVERDLIARVPEAIHEEATRRLIDELTLLEESSK